jgi:hypothetical protein
MILGDKKMRKAFLSVLISVALALLTVSSAAFAQEAAFTLKISAEMKDILSENTGKRVAIRLASGEEIEGTVTMVGKTLVHISRLAGKEFYDAVVSIDKISAVRIKARDR